VEEEMKKIILTLIILVIGIILIDSVNAGLSKLDKTDDVILVTQINDEQNIIKNQTYPNIDIFKLSSLFDKDENKLYLYIIINENGTIQINENVNYQLWFNTTNASYFINFTNNINNGFIYNNDIGEFISSDLSVTSNKYSIIAEYPIVGTSTDSIDFNACITEKKTTNEGFETYIDCVPEREITSGNGGQTDDNSQNDNNGNQSTDTNGNQSTDTNGFMVSIMFLSIAIIMYLKRRKIN
jgi:hemolysin activation/secretion protein